MSAIKHDQEKPKLSLIPYSAIAEEAAVMAYGDSKYGRGNWKKGLAWSRLIDAALRHLNAFAAGEDNDPETGLSHLAHARSCCAFLLEYRVTNKLMDDRNPHWDEPGGGHPVMPGDHKKTPIHHTVWVPPPGEPK